MRRAYLSEHGKSSLDVIEEAFLLLRHAPGPALAAYYAGTLPFAFAALYLSVETLSGRFAARDLGGGALALAVLFAWMKCAQTVFARRLRAEMAGAGRPRWTLRALVRACAIQTFVQPSGLFALPIAALAAVPFGWVYAFYQSLTVLGDGESEDFRSALREAQEQCLLWPKENHLVIGALAAFGVFVAANWLAAFWFFPLILKGCFGVETIFRENPLVLLDPAVLGAAAALTYLSVDPLAKAAYVVRCFYGRSVRSGEDLEAQLRALEPPSGTRAARRAIPAALAGAALAGALAAGGRPALAAPEAVGRTAVSTGQIERAISEVLSGDKYRWARPGAEAEESPRGEGAIARTVKSAFESLRYGLQAAWRWMRKLFERLFPGREERAGTPGSPAAAPAGTPLALLAVLTALVALFAAAILYRLARPRPAPGAAPAGRDARPAVDLADENLEVEKLPEDEWTRLGLELLERGEWRLALRAFYLSSLAHLAARELIAPERYKSNRDYERELERRARSAPRLVSLFRAIVSVFERVWYGLHRVDRELARRFAAAVERLKTVG